MDKFPSTDKPINHDDARIFIALSEANRLQEAVINTSDLPVLSLSLRGIVTGFNKAAENLLGYTAAEVIGTMTLDRLCDAAEIAHRKEELQRNHSITVTSDTEAFFAVVRKTQSPERRECTCIRSDGGRVPVLLSLAPLQNEGGQIIGFSAVLTDITDQKRNEERLRRSESQLQALVSSIDDIVFELDEEGRHISIWVQDDSYLFLPREKILGKTLTEMFGEPFARPFNEGFRQVLNHGGVFNREYRTTQPGDERWFNARYGLIYEDGKPTRRVSVCIQDITVRKKAELLLRQSEEKFRLMAENVPGVIYLCHNDELYSMIYLSERVETITGYKADEFISGRVSFTELFHPEDSAYVRTTIDNALAKRTSFVMAYRLRNRAGHYIWVEEVGTGVYNGDELTMLEGFICDITLRKTAEEELKRVADENHRVFTHSLNLNAIANFDGYFVKLNPAWTTTLGWSLEELQRNKFITFVHPDDIEKTEEVFRNILQGEDGTTGILENRYRDIHGGYRWLLWSSSQDQNQKLIYASAIDITDRKKYEEQLLLSKKSLEATALELEEQNRRLDEFAHIISHNLRSPIGNIKALIGLLNENSPISEYQLIFEKLKNVSSNLSETMNELMETLKVKKSTEIERTEIRFKEILDKVIQSLEGEMIQCEATVTFDFNDAPKIVYHKPYLESIFQNLLTNAIKYRSPHRDPRIHIITRQSPNGIELRVQDNGLGIDLVQFGDKLFGLHKTFHENKEARGVGLFLTKTQIEALGGKIHAESEVDRGTTFIVCF
jgi:PAS domain S-box-containing protein